jgi:IS605 OrfB family transposase
MQSLLSPKIVPQHIAVKCLIDMSALGKGSNGSTSQVNQLKVYSKATRDAYNWALELYSVHYDFINSDVREQALTTAHGDEILAKALFRAREDKVTGWDRKKAYEKAYEKYGKSFWVAGTKIDNLFTYALRRTAKIQDFPKWILDFVDNSSRVRWDHLKDSYSVEFDGELYPLNRRTIVIALNDFRTAVKKFQDTKSGVLTKRSKKPRKDGKPEAFPRFRSYRDDQSFAIRMDSLPKRNRLLPYNKEGFLTSSRVINIPQLGSIRIDRDSHKRLQELIKADGELGLDAHFTETNGQWSVSFLFVMPVEWVPANWKATQTEVGVDVGVSIMGTLSTGELFYNPNKTYQNSFAFNPSEIEQARTKRLLILKKKIVKKQQELALKPTYKELGRNSKSRQKVVTELDRLHKEETTIRGHARHEMTAKLVQNFSLIAIEDLNVKGMTGKVLPKENPDMLGTFLPNGKAAKSGLNRAILQIAFGELKRQIEYKSKLYGREVLLVDQWYASSKICSDCGNKKTGLKLSERVYSCDACGLVIDRDLNAARNILAEAKRNRTGKKVVLLDVEARNMANSLISQIEASKSSTQLKSLP